MRPGNKREVAVLAMADSLPALTAEHRNFMKRGFGRYAMYRMNGRVKCCVCGLEYQTLPETAKYWKESLYSAMELMDEEFCPDCGAELQPHYNRRRFEQSETLTMQIMTEYKGYQVFRIIEMVRYVRPLMPTLYDFNELYQVWLDDKGREVIVTRPYTRTPYIIRFRYDEPWTIGRHNQSTTGAYYMEDMFDCATRMLYPKIKASAALIRNGWDNMLNSIYTVTDERYPVVFGMLTDARMEHFAKAGQYDLLRWYSTRPAKLSDFWPSLRVALRHKYIIKDIDLWEDMVRFLREMGKDVLSPHYICPDNLNAAHDYWFGKVRAKEAAEKRREIAKNDKMYYSRHAQFDGLEFTGALHVIPLLTATALHDEGEAMHHCVATYVDRHNSLILSARDEQGKRVETIEVNLKKYTIEQAHGYCNAPSLRHQEVIDAVNAMLPDIRRRNLAAVKE